MVSTKLNSQVRAAFSMAEFAKLFGKGVTWSYRQVYAGKVKPVTEFGRMLIPAAEVDRILATAGIYDGAKPKLAKTKAQIQRLVPKLSGAWEEYISRRQIAATKESGKSVLEVLASSRGKRRAGGKSATLRSIAKKTGKA